MGLLGDIKCPCLVIGGQDDIFTPRWMAEETHEALPDSEIHLYDGAGHAFHWEKLDDFNPRVRDWLAAVAHVTALKTRSETHARMRKDLSGSGCAGRELWTESASGGSTRVRRNGASGCYDVRARQARASLLRGLRCRRTIG